MKGEFTRNLSVWNPTVGVASYVAAFSWYFFGLICWMRDDLPLLSSPSTRMCTSLSFFESAAVRRFNIAKYKKARCHQQGTGQRYLDTADAPGPPHQKGKEPPRGSENIRTCAVRRRSDRVRVTFTVTGAQLRRPAESESRSRSLPGPPGPSQARLAADRETPNPKPGPFGPRGILSTQRH